MTDLDYGRLAPEIVLLGGAVAVLLGGSFLPRERQWLLTGVALAALIASAVLGVVAVPGAVFSGTFVIDGLTRVVRVVAPAATGAVLVLGARERRGSVRESETVSLLLLATLGTVVVAGAADLLVLGAGTLLVAVPVVGLIGIDRGAPAAEATLKTYLIGALFGLIMLGGVAVLIAALGSSAYDRFTASGGSEAGLGAVATIGAVAVAAVLLFEAGAVPAHFWLPDAAQASSRQVAAFVTTVPKLGALVALLRLVTATRPVVDLPLLIGVVAAATVLLGAFAAFRQTDVRRLLGWSAVSQAGFLLIAVASASPAALAVYLAGYAAANVTAFAVVAALPARTALADWRGAARAHPFLVAALLVGLLSMVGTPPTAVFLGKLVGFEAAWAGGQAWLVVVGATASLASLYYALRWISACFLRPKRASPPATRADAPASVVALATGVLVVGFAAVVPLLAF